MNRKTKFRMFSLSLLMLGVSFSEANEMLNQHSNLQCAMEGASNLGGAVAPVFVNFKPWSPEALKLAEPAPAFKPPKRQEDKYQTLEECRFGLGQIYNSTPRRFLCGFWDAMSPARYLVRYSPFTVIPGYLVGLLLFIPAFIYGFLCIASGKESKPKDWDYILNSRQE